MEVPALSMPRFGDVFGFFRRTWVLYGLYTLLLFAVFIVVTLPYEVIARRVLDLLPQKTVSTTIEGAHFAWWNGIEASDFRVSALPLKEGAPPLLEIARLQVRPDWGQWLRGQLTSLAFWGDLYGGSADGRLQYHQTDPPSFSAHLEWSGVEIRRYRALTNWLDQGRVTGTLAGWFDAHAAAGSPAEGEGEIFLQRAGITEGKVMGFTVPDLKVEDAKSKFVLKGDRLDVQDVVLAGDEINIQVSGFISLRQPLGQSIPNLKLSIQKLPESLKPLLAIFAPRAKQLPAQLQLTGTLGRPQVR